jgi:hypothetical protein
MDSSSVNALSGALQGNQTWGSALGTVGGNIGDRFAGGMIDRATGQPISQYANIANMIAQGVAPGSAFAQLTNAISHPVSTAVNYASNAGASAATTTGTDTAASNAGSAAGGSAGGSTLGNVLGTAAALYGAYQGAQGASAAYRAGDVKSGMVAGAEAGSSIGSIWGPLGTAAGAIIGGGLGALYTGASTHTNERNIQDRAWSQFARHTDENTSFRGSGFPVEAAFDGAMRSNNDRDQSLLNTIGDTRQGGFPSSMYARQWLINQIQSAQASGKLPPDGQLSQLDGRNFFNEELSSQLGGNDKVKRLLAEMTDNIFQYGTQAPGGSHPVYNSDGSFNEAAARGQH